MSRKLSKFEKDMFRDLGLSPKQAAELSHEERMQRVIDYYEQGDAEVDAKCHKEAAIAQQREGEAKYIARLQPQQQFCHWVVSYTDVAVIDPETKQQHYCISVCQSPEGSIMGHKTTNGRPTADDVISALQVSMAFPMMGKGKRPIGVLVAWRMRDMWPKLEKFFHEMEIWGRLETREQAEIACAQHGTDIEGRNNPVSDDDFEVPREEVLKEEGNRLFSIRRYAKAAEKYTEAMEHDPKSAVLYSNRATTYVHMGLHTKALADAEKAIKLDPEYIKAHARKGQALEKLGRVDEARTHYQHCIKILKHNSHFKEALKNLDAAQGLAERTAALHVS